MHGCGHGRGRGRGRGRRVLRFLQPCLLLLLNESEAHGYRLREQIGRFGFDSQEFDPSLIYRTLREMEDVGWIQSRESTESKGPPRRVYSLSGEGIDQLAFWASDLRRVRNEIDAFLKAFETSPHMDHNISHQPPDVEST